MKVLQETPGFQEAIELKSALSGDTPLLWACENNELAVAEWLVRHWRADITHADDHGRNACLKAAWKGHVRIIEWAMELGCDHLKRSICNDSMVHEAAYMGRLNVVEYCAHRLGMPLDDPNELGETPFILAAAPAHIEVLEFLCQPQHAINYWQLGDRGRNAVHYVAISGMTLAFEWMWENLLDKMKWDEPDFDEKRPVELACDCGNDKAAQFLVDALGITDTSILRRIDKSMLEYGKM